MPILRQNQRKPRPLAVVGPLQQILVVERGQIDGQLGLDCIKIVIYRRSVKTHCRVNVQFLQVRRVDGRLDKVGVPRVDEPLVQLVQGIVLVLAAMALNMYTHARHREWGEFIFSPNGLVGMVTYLCGVDLASAYMGAVTFMPQVLAVVGMVVGLVLLLFAELLAPMVEGKPWKPAGGMGNYLMQSVFELLETVLSYLSNTISFLRVGAFVIVHASMMMVVFTLAGTPNNIVVVILGNLVVICLEALLSAIQGIRLEFYEMFSRCYKGGGRKFVAFDLKKAKA